MIKHEKEQANRDANEKRFLNALSEPQLKPTNGPPPTIDEDPTDEQSHQASEATNTPAADDGEESAPTTPTAPQSTPTGAGQKMNRVVSQPLGTCASPNIDRSSSS